MQHFYICEDLYCVRHDWLPAEGIEGMCDNFFSLILSLGLNLTPKCNGHIEKLLICHVSYARENI